MLATGIFSYHYVVESWWIGLEFPEKWPEMDAIRNLEILIVDQDGLDGRGDQV